MGARRILVVDDCADTVEIVSTLFSILGHECQGASSGAAAIEAALGFQPEIVLLDLALPDLSGFEVARELRARCRHDFYLAAMTGWDGKRAREQTRASGFHQHLVKPIDRRTLCALVQLAGRGAQ